MTVEQKQKKIITKIEYVNLPGNWNAEISYCRGNNRNILNNSLSEFPPLDLLFLLKISVLKKHEKNLDSFRPVLLKRMRNVNFAEALEEIQRRKLGERGEFEKLLKENHVKIEPMPTERGRARDNKRERGGSDTEGKLLNSSLPDKGSLSANFEDDPRGNIQIGRSTSTSSSSTQARSSFKTNPSTPARNQKIAINNQPNLVRPTTSASHSVTNAPFTTILNETPSRNSFNPITPTSLPPAAKRSNDSEDLSPASDDEITPTRISNKRGKKRLRFAEDDIDANQYEPSSPENTRQIGHSQNFKRPRSNTDVNFNQAGTSAREDETPSIATVSQSSAQSKLIEVVNNMSNRIDRLEQRDASVSNLETDFETLRQDINKLSENQNEQHPFTTQLFQKMKQKIGDLESNYTVISSKLTTMESAERKREKSIESVMNKNAELRHSFNTLKNELDVVKTENKNLRNEMKRFSEFMNYLSIYFQRG